MKRETWAALLAGLVTTGVTAALADSILVGLVLGLVATLLAAAILDWMDHTKRDTSKEGTRQRWP